MISYAVKTNNLTKQFNDLKAVNNINLNIELGVLFGFLGPNGAGKSTTIKILSTILMPTSGSVSILGYDLKKDKKKIRELIGVCPQELVMYPMLSARENIHLIAQMHNLRPSVYKQRTDELLTQMRLFDRANDKIKKFSGGMKRRVNILMSLIHEPEIIFFDEPTAGLDPQSRRVVWDFIKDLQEKNKTIILTTHNMEEADDLSDVINIIDKGQIIAQGSPQELKNRVGKGKVIIFRLPESELHHRDTLVKTLLNHPGIKNATILGKERILVNTMDSLNNFSEIYEFISIKLKIQMEDIVIRQKTLEDVFIHLTGRELRE